MTQNNSSFSSSYTHKRLNRNDIKLINNSISKQHKKLSPVGASKARLLSESNFSKTIVSIQQCTKSPSIIRHIYASPHRTMTMPTSRIQTRASKITIKRGLKTHRKPSDLNFRILNQKIGVLEADKHSFTIQKNTDYMYSALAEYAGALAEYVQCPDSTDSFQEMMDAKSYSRQIEESCRQDSLKLKKHSLALPRYIKLRSANHRTRSRLRDNR